MSKNDFEVENTNSESQNEEHSHRRRTDRDPLDKVVHWLDKNHVSFIWIITSFIMGIVFVALTIFTIITVSNNTKTTNELYAENFNLQAKIADYKGKIFIENDKYLSKMLLNLLLEDKLVSLTKDNWLYKITVNGEVIKDILYYVYTPNVEISISETELESDKKFPEDINAKGSVTGGEKNVSYSDFITVSGTTSKPTIESKIEGKTKITTYKFNDLKVGEIEYINLDSELATRLGLSDNKIEILFPKNNTGGK